MNQQNPGIEWTHVWGRPGYTWNPVQGCYHGCEWNMPDGSVAKCYAKGIAEKFSRPGFFESGFKNHYWNPKRLQEPMKLSEPAGIFLDSMSDLMGAWVPDEQVEAVLDVCRKASHHIFFLLTKNAPRLLKFEFPTNVWVGVSMPPDTYLGRQLTRFQQERMLAVTLNTLLRLRHGRHERAATVWMSFEPLSWDVSGIVREQAVYLDWAVIGAASNGPRYYLPDTGSVSNLLEVLDAQGTPVFFKGNLNGCPAAVPWREEYPGSFKPFMGLI